MKRPTTRSAPYRAWPVLTLLFVLLGLTGSATAQTFVMQNGATLRIAGGGTLDLNGTTLDFGGVTETSVLDEAPDGRVTGGPIVAVRPLDAPSGDNVAGLGLTITSAATLGATTITRRHTAQDLGLAASIARTYDVSPTTNTGLDATLGFAYRDAELNGVDEATLEFYRSTDDGTSWAPRGVASRDAAANTATLGGIDALSRWTLGGAGASPTAPFALVEITPDAGLGASTFAGSSFQITNSGSEAIVSVAFDLSTGILPDMVFDPVGSGGDATAKCLTADAGATATGFASPSDPCVDPFSVPRNGGFDVMALSFSDFEPGEQFVFSVDVDPNSIQGIPGAGNAGAVSGFELAGATVTVTFVDGTVVTANLYEDGSLGGGQAVVTGGVPAAPSISAQGIGAGPALLSTANQTIEVTGTPGANISLLQMDSRLAIASGDPPFDVSPAEEPFYANEAMAKVLYSGTVPSGGVLAVPVTLLQTAGSSGAPDGGVNQLIAVQSDGPYAVDQPVSPTSNVLTLSLVEDTEPPVITLLGDDPLTLTVGDTYTEPGATATDNVDGDLTDEIIIDASAVDVNTPGTYVVTYNVSDAAGNAAAEVVRTVDVEPALASCTSTSLAEGAPYVGDDGIGRIDLTFSSPDGITAIDFSMLNNLELDTSTPAFTGETTGGDGLPIYTYGAAPTSIDITLRQVDTGNPDAGYFGIASSVCPAASGGTLATEFDPPVGFALPTPDRFALVGNYPNPFRGRTTVQFALPEASPVTLAIYDVLGRQVALLVDGELPAGRHDVQWNGRSVNQAALGSGVYFVRMRAGAFTATRRLLLVH